MTAREDALNALNSIDEMREAPSFVSRMYSGGQLSGVRYILDSVNAIYVVAFK